MYIHVYMYAPYNRLRNSISDTECRLHTFQYPNEKETKVYVGYWDITQLAAVYVAAYVCTHYMFKINLIWCIVLGI